MPTYKCPLFIVLTLSLYANRSAQPVDSEPPVEPCPAAALWTRGHPPPPDTRQAKRLRDAAVPQAELLEQLRVRVDSDQSARRKWLAAPKNQNLVRALGATDDSNLAWLRQVILERGFPTAAQVGKEGVHFAWLLLQHADQDPKLQSDMLPVLEQRYSAGELPANDLARFTDRVLVASGKPQRFGTQFDWVAGDFKLPEGSRLAEIDADRGRIGLMPLADYVCTIRSARARVISSEVRASGREPN
jgi:hypothetical protein